VSLGNVMRFLGLRDRESEDHEFVPEEFYDAKRRRSRCDAGGIEEKERDSQCAEVILYGRFHLTR